MHYGHILRADHGSETVIVNGMIKDKRIEKTEKNILGICLEGALVLEKHVKKYGEVQLQY